MEEGRQTTQLEPKWADEHVSWARTAIEKFIVVQTQQLEPNAPPEKGSGTQPGLLHHAAEVETRVYYIAVGNNEDLAHQQIDF